MKKASKEAYGRVAGDRDLQLISRDIKNRGYLGIHELIYIAMWKLPENAEESEYGKIWKKVVETDPKEIEEITREAFKLADQDKVEEAIRLLNKLPRVKTRVASAILTFYDPKKFGVLDVNAWRALYKEEKEDFEPEDYRKYLGGIRKKARECGMTPRQVDLALWKIGQKSFRKKVKKD